MDARGATMPWKRDEGSGKVHRAETENIAQNLITGARISRSRHGIGSEAKGETDLPFRRTVRHPPAGFQ